MTPATGGKLVQMGQQAGGLYGLGVLNAASSQFQLVTGASSATARASQTTSSLTDVSFSDDPVVTVVIGQSGSAQVTFGASIGTGGDGDAGYTDLTVDGAWLVPGGGGSVLGECLRLMRRRRRPSRRVCLADTGVDRVVAGQPHFLPGLFVRHRCARYLCQQPVCHRVSASEHVPAWLAE